MNDPFSRTELLLGKEAMDTLRGSHVAVFGIGGVGGYTVEALARCGIGSFTLVDNDTVSLTNLNRQIVATHASVGRLKTEVMKERILDINPDASVTLRSCFFLPENEDTFDFSSYSYVVDAVDTVTAKIAIIRKAIETGVPVISSMGTGNKLDPSAFEVADISKTSVCPLARVMRRELKKRGIEHVKVVYSREQPLPHVSASAEQPQEGRRSVPGSISFVPPAAGLLLAGEVVKDLIRLPR